MWYRAEPTAIFERRRCEPAEQARSTRRGALIRGKQVRDLSSGPRRVVEQYKMSVGTAMKGLGPVP